MLRFEPRLMSCYHRALSQVVSLLHHSPPPHQVSNKYSLPTITSHHGKAYQLVLKKSGNFSIGFNKEKKAKRSAKQQRPDVRICFCLLALRRSDANRSPPAEELHRSVVNSADRCKKTCNMVIDLQDATHCCTKNWGTERR